MIYGMKRCAQQGVGWLALASIAGGFAIGALFVRRQRRLADPLIDLGLFRTPAFSASLATYMLGTLVTFGSYVVVVQYLQLVLGLPPLSAGLWILPWSGSYIVGSFLAPVLARRFQRAYVIAGGLLLAAGGFLAFTFLAGPGVEAAVIASTVYSLGMSPVFTLSTDLIIGAAPARARRRRRSDLRDRFRDGRRARDRGAGQHRNRDLSRQPGARGSGPASPKMFAGPRWTRSVARWRRLQSDRRMRRARSCCMPRALRSPAPCK